MIYPCDTYYEGVKFLLPPEPICEQSLRAPVPHRAPGSDRLRAVAAETLQLGAALEAPLIDDPDFGERVTVGGFTVQARGG